MKLSAVTWAANFVKPKFFRSQIRLGSILLSLKKTCSVLVSMPNSVEPIMAKSSNDGRALALYGDAGHHGISYAVGEQHSVGYSDCDCGVVIDTYTYLALMSFIFLATYFLWVAITMNITGRKRRKRTTFEHMFDLYFAGMKHHRYYFWIDLFNQHPDFEIAWIE